MTGTYTIDYINSLPVEKLVEILRASGARIDGMTIPNMKLAVVKILASDNMLDSKDETALSVPFFDQIYIREHEHLIPTLAHLAVDLTPGVSMLTTLERISGRLK